MKQISIVEKDAPPLWEQGRGAADPDGVGFRLVRSLLSCQALRAASLRPGTPLARFPRLQPTPSGDSVFSTAARSPVRAAAEKNARSWVRAGRRVVPVIWEIYP